MKLCEALLVKPPSNSEPDFSGESMHSEHPIVMSFLLSASTINTVAVVTTNTLLKQTKY